MFKKVGMCLLYVVVGFLIGQGIFHMVSKYETYQATSKAQAFVDQRVNKVVGTWPVVVKAKVSDCVELPSTEATRNWDCVVTITAPGLQKSQVLEFSPNNLAGKEDPAEDETPEFDHDKDTNI